MNELIFFEKNEPQSDIREYTSDGRNKNKFSIIVKPDDRYPNPDETGNGVDTSVENYYNSNVKALQSKSMLNNIQNLLSHIATNINNTYIKIGCNDKNTFDFIKVLFRNTIHTNALTKIENNYSYSRFNIYDKLTKIINFMKMKFSKENMLNMYNKMNNENPIKYYTLKTLFSLYKIKHEEFNQVRFNEVFGTDINRIKDIYNDIVKSSEFINKIEIIKLCNSKLKELKSELSTYSESEAEMLFETISNFYTFILSLSQFINVYCNDVISYFKMITPISSDTKIIVNQSSLISNIEKINPYISSDYHLLREILKGDRNDLSRSEGIIEMHNKIVKPNDVFLFLGDLSEEEFYEAGSDAIKQKLIDMCKRMNGRKIMIYGNNDTTDIDFYHRKCGFIEVYKNPILTKKHGFSHGPIDTGDVMNVHGHIHGSKQYWGIDYHNHIDVYYGVWGQPVKLSYLDNKQIQQFYYNGCIAKTPDFVDPEVIKTYSNKIN